MIKVILFSLIICTVSFSSETTLILDKSYIWTGDDVYDTDDNSSPIINACWNIPDVIMKAKSPYTGNTSPLYVGHYKKMVEHSIQRMWFDYADISIDFQENGLGALCDIHIVHEDGSKPPHTKNIGKLLKRVPRGVVLNFTLVDWPFGNARFIKNTNKEYDERWRKARIIEIALHEFGHVLGLIHCRNKRYGRILDYFDHKSIMNANNPRLSTEGIYPQTSTSVGDIAVLQTLYGFTDTRIWDNCYPKLKRDPGSIFGEGETDVPVTPDVCGNLINITNSPDRTFNLLPATESMCFQAVNPVHYWKPSFFKSTKLPWLKYRVAMYYRRKTRIDPEHG